MCVFHALTIQMLLSLIFHSSSLTLISRLDAVNAFFSTGECMGLSMSLSYKTYGIQLDQTDTKKTQGYVIKWFHLIGATRDSEKAPNTVVLHHARKKAFGSAGFQDTDPRPEETTDASRLTILKYPKLQMEHLYITCRDPKAAKKLHNGILKRLRLLGQSMFWSFSVFIIWCLCTHDDHTLQIIY